MFKYVKLFMTNSEDVSYEEFGNGHVFSRVLLHAQGLKFVFGEFRENPSNWIHKLANVKLIVKKVSQYFEYKKGRVNSFDFDRLEKRYARVQLVNEGLLERIRSLGNRDADKNAIITLHSISQFLSMEMDFSLTTIAHLFERGPDA